MTSLPSGTGLQLMTVCAFSLTLFSVVGLYFLFTQMDLSRTVEFSSKLELEEDAPDNKGTSLTPNAEDDTPKRRYLTQYRRIVLMLTVGIITILVYLILVFSNAPSWLEWVGMLIILILLGPILQYGDEIRRQRYDRLALLLTLILVLAAGLNLAVYAANQYADEDVYEGMARIVSYQDDNYDNAKGEEVTRTDLLVAWGGSWGCPHNPDQYCEAAIPGALCDSSLYEERKLDQNNNDGGGDGGDGGQDDAVDAADGNADAAAGAGDDDVQAAYEQLKQDYETLEENYENLQEQNQQLQYDLVSAVAGVPFLT